MKKMAGLLIFYLLLMWLPAQAVSLSDLQIAVRALGFTNNPPSGNLSLGIVYVDSIPNSVDEAHKLQDILGDGLQVGNLFLKPVMVPVNDVENANVGLFFMTGGIGSSAQRVLSASNQKQILCVTTDVAQVMRGLCALGVKSQPKIEIIVNRAAAANSGITFSSAFSMMITEY
jgi:hypothetical protein